MSKWMIAVLLVGAVSCPSVAQAQRLLRAGWYGSADFFVATRSMSDTVFQRNQEDLVDDTGAVISTVVGTENLLPLDLDFTPGGRITLGRRIGEFGFEGTYSQTGRWSAYSAVSSASGMAASPFSLVGSDVDPAFDNNTLATVQYETEMLSGELQMTQLAYSNEDCDATFLYGLRTMWIDESFSYSSTNATGDNILNTAVENWLIGPQVGLRTNSLLWYGDLGIVLKGGLLANDIDFGSDFNGNLVARSDGYATLLFDFAIDYTFRPRRNVAVHFGYQLLALSDVGLATNDPLIAEEITDNVAYQAPYIGVSIMR